MIALDVIVKYGVGEKANSGAWGDLCRFAYEKGFNKDDVLDSLKTGEQEYLERTGEGVPSAYRSAKSVLKNAMTWGVAVIGDNNEPIGKSAVEASIKEAKNADKPEKSVSDVMDECVAKMRKAFNTLPDEVSKTAMQHYVNGIVPSIWGY